MPHQLVDIIEHLVAYQRIFHILLAQLHIVEQINITKLLVADGILVAFTTIVINDQVVSDTRHKCIKLSGIRVASLFYGHDDLHECFLKDIVSQVAITNHHEDVREHTALVAA